MPTLRELQAGIAAALLFGDTAVEAWIEASVPAAATRLEIHHNTVLVSLIDALAATFPVVRRLVDPRFFAYAATVFVRTRPPRRPCLAEYDADFPDFLAGFAACRALTYLPDVARLEWAIGRMARAVERPPLAPQTLAVFTADEAERMTFAFQPTIAMVSSRFPIDAIWYANRPEGAEETVDLAAGAADLEIRKHADGVALHHLDHAVFAFRVALISGATLRAATDAALASDPNFALGYVLAELFHDGAIVAAKPAT